jgi:ribosomal-protein-alanine N-acetyltransferase
MDGTPVQIRPMRTSDLDRVCAIEEEIFPMPWSRTSFEAELAADRCAFPWVVEKEGEVVAYLVSWLVEDELHVGNIAVAPSLQGEGVGRAYPSPCARGTTRTPVRTRSSCSRRSRPGMRGIDTSA